MAESNLTRQEYDIIQSLAEKGLLLANFSNPPEHDRAALRFALEKLNAQGITDIALTRDGKIANPEAALAALSDPNLPSIPANVKDGINERLLPRMLLLDSLSLSQDVKEVNEYYRGLGVNANLTQADLQWVQDYFKTPGASAEVMAYFENPGAPAPGIPYFASRGEKGAADARETSRSAGENLHLSPSARNEIDEIRTRVGSLPSQNVQEGELPGAAQTARVKAAAVVGVGGKQ